MNVEQIFRLIPLRYGPRIQVYVFSFDRFLNTANLQESIAPTNSSSTRQNAQHNGKTTKISMLIADVSIYTVDGFYLQLDLYMIGHLAWLIC